MSIASASYAISQPSNFRDLAAHARLSPALRSGVLFRSDHLGALNDEDARQIVALGIARVLDFRGVAERESAACRLPGVAVHSLPIEPTVVQRLVSLVGAGTQVTAADMVGLMQETYRGFVRGGTPRFAEFFGHLLASGEPTVFHCTAGKDRTGFAAALLLSALGAHPDEVMADYLLTNERLKPPPTAGQGLPPEAAQVLWRVQPEFLHAAWQALEADFGGIEGYLTQGLGLGAAERERLAQLYLAA